jgi:hypothetical protein
MSLKLATYDSITSELNTILNSGCTPHVSLFTDLDGTTIFTDSNGNTCQEKTLASINYTQPHNDSDGNQIINGYLLLTFSDGNNITITDNVDTVYFSITAVPFKPRQF